MNIDPSHNGLRLIDQFKDYIDQVQGSIVKTSAIGILHTRYTHVERYVKFPLVKPNQISRSIKSSCIPSEYPISPNRLHFSQFDQIVSCPHRRISNLTEIHFRLSETNQTFTRIGPGTSTASERHRRHLLFPLSLSIHDVIFRGARQLRIFTNYKHELHLQLKSSTCTCVGIHAPSSVGYPYIYNRLTNTHTHLWDMQPTNETGHDTS